MAPARAVGALLVSSLVVAAPVEGQLLNKLKKKVDEAKSAVVDAKETVDGAQDIRCEVQGVCGEVWQSELFTPELYRSLAVTVYDASGRYRTANIDGIMRNPFEGQLLENGFMLAASADAEAVRQRIGRSEESWSDSQLSQLKDFVDSVDAVLVVQIDGVVLDRCERDNKVGTEATLHVSARFLNVDAGDIPWVARHTAVDCADGGSAALAAALEKATSQLAGILPAAN